MAKRTVDYDLIVDLWDKGSTFKEIMQIAHCCDGTIRNALEAAGREIPLDRPVKRYLQDKVPIYPEEIIQYRERLKIGSIVKLPQGEEKSRCPVGGKYTVIAKYPAFFIAVRGQHERHELYVTMILREREKA